AASSRGPAGWRRGERGHRDGGCGRYGRRTAYTDTSRPGRPDHRHPLQGLWAAGPDRVGFLACRFRTRLGTLRGGNDLTSGHRRGVSATAGAPALRTAGGRRDTSGHKRIQGKTEGIRMNTISISERAASHIARYLERRGKGIGLRPGIQPRGSSGLAYKMEYVDEPRAEDLLFEQHGVKVFVDPESMQYIDGTEVDFVREGLNEGFKFVNPNEKASCGCGESFTV